jgi:GDP-L-fucose synthase
MKILVTGATGFLGKALCRALRAAGHRVVGLGSKDCDLTRDGALEAFDAPRYDHIYHLAAWTQAGDFCLHHPGEQWVINQRINTNVLDWWRTHQPQAKLICMGTSCAYAPGDELVESNYLEGLPIDGLMSYAMTKRMLHVGLLSLHRQYNLPYLCLVPSTLYGPGYHTDGRQMHFIFDLMRKIVHGRQTGQRVTLWGDGYQRRELVHLDDFVRIAIELASNVTNELVNIGAGEEHTIRHFAGLICDQVGFDRELVHYDTTKYVGARSKCLRVDKLRSLMPALRLTPLEEGMASTVDWYCTQGAVQPLAA